MSKNNNLDFNSLSSLMARELLYNFVIEKKGELSCGEECTLDALIETLEWIKNESKKNKRSDDFRDLEKWIIIKKRES